MLFRSELLGADVVESQGKMYPVDLRYGEDRSDTPIGENMARNLMRIISEEKGDVLAFLPGERDIRICEELLKTRLDEDYAITPLYGMLDQRTQQAALSRNPQGKRKIVLATSIAETSLTIDGIRIVVDSGWSRRMRYNPSTGLSGLETVRVSKDIADQRAGRAGRLEAGICYRLWNKAIQERLEEHRKPEIDEADLTSLALELANWGCEEVMSMSWLTLPPKKNIF